ncbi:hypothetical protein DIPPA_31652 [Diplonema papillatum]|nr:hypothetical protein DIPPA_31652 [Diplonema papillatum]
MDLWVWAWAPASKPGTSPKASQSGSWWFVFSISDLPAQQPGIAILLIAF